jgi:hypothetical protein
MMRGQQAREIVLRIIIDLTDRRGLRQQWEEINDEIRDEIVAQWEKLTREVLTAPSSSTNTPSARMPTIKPAAAREAPFARTPRRGLQRVQAGPPVSL